MGMWILIVSSLGIAVLGIVLSNNPQLLAKLGILQAMQKSNVAKKSREIRSSDLSPDELKKMKQTVEEFLEFDKIYDGMISFVNDPTYFTMGFGVHGININMYNPQEKIALKNGFMGILNTLKDDTQFLVQSRYVNLSKNFEYYKPIVEANERERDILLNRIKDEKSEVLKSKFSTKAAHLKQRNAYAKHIMEFFDYYVKESECIYIKIFVFVNYRYEAKTNFFLSKNKMLDEAFNALSNKVKILKEQFESIGLKAYTLDSKSTANVIYSTMAKSESSYQTLEDALNNGLLDLVIENRNQEQVKEDKTYSDDYEYEWREEAAISIEEEDEDINSKKSKDKPKVSAESLPLAIKKDMEIDLDDEDQYFGKKV